MNSEVPNLPPAPPRVTMPDPSIYKTMGLEGISAMVEAVYLGLADSPIAHMFPTDREELLAAARKSALFWATACGGPPLYEERHGPPRMKMRHARFEIDLEARQQWLDCWYPVLSRAERDFGFPGPAMDSFVAYLEDFSLWMVNKA